MNSPGSFSEISSRDALVRMLTYAIRCPPVARVAVERLIATHFDEATQLEFMTTWHSAQEYWRVYQQAPTREVLRALSVNVMAGQGYTNPGAHQMAYRLVDEIYDFHEDPWNVDFGLRLVSAFFNQVFTKNIQQLMAQFGSDRGALMDAVGEAHQKLQVGMDKPVALLDLNEHLPDGIARVPTGVAPFDMLLGGGTTPTEVYGILGPSGGGKTLLAIQIACSMAERQQYVDYFTYEQPPKELQPRFLSCAAKVKVSDIAGKRWTELDPLIQQKVRDAADMAAKYLHVHDRSVRGDSVQDIIGAVRESIDAGRKPRMVVVDWVWPLILRMTATSERRGVEERKMLQFAMDQFKSAAAEYGVTFLILHQLSTEMAKQSPSKKPEWFNSAEAGSLAWLMHYCLAIGRADPQGYCWLVGSKARGTAPDALIVKRIGEYQRFQSTKSSMVYDDRRKEFVDDGGQNRVPGVQIPTADTEHDDAAQVDTTQSDADDGASIDADEFAQGEGGVLV